MAGDLLGYVDFILRISPSPAADHFVVKAVSPFTGEASGIFVPPFSGTELENFILKVGMTRRGVRRIHSPEWRAALDFGERLYSGLFQDDIRASFLSSRYDAMREGKGLRIKIVLDAPALADYPWEFLYDPSLGRFLTLYEGTPLVRYVELPVPPLVLRVAPPLRILVLAASPADLPPLDIAWEKGNLDTALAELILSGLVSVEWVEGASLEALHLCLLKREAHVFHFIGHGYYDQTSLDGMLALEDEAKHSKLVSSEKLAVVLGNHPSLRLAVLNACEGGRASVQDPLGSAATTLLRSGSLAAVVAMQFEITDAASIAFTSGFYSALAQGRPVDAAVSQGRLSIFTGDNDVEWATPVLYLRSPDGIIFAQPSPEAAAPAELEGVVEMPGRLPVETERPGEMEPGAKGRRAPAALPKKERVEKPVHVEKAARPLGPPSASFFLTALAWAIGVGVGLLALPFIFVLLIGSNILTPENNASTIIWPVLRGLQGAAGGVACGIIVRKKTPPVNLKQYLLAAAGWGIGWGIVEAIYLWYTPGTSLFTFLPGVIGGLLCFLGVLAIGRAKLNLRLSPSFWGILGRLAVVALLFSGVLGPWYQLTSCTPFGSRQPPTVDIEYGYEVLFSRQLISLLVVPVILLFGIVLLRVTWPRLRRENTSVWLERIGAAASVFGLGFVAAVFYEILLWGFWATFNGCSLSLLVQAVEWYRGESSRLQASSPSPPVGWRRFWRALPVILAAGLLLAVLIATAYAWITND